MGTRPPLGCHLDIQSGMYSEADVLSTALGLLEDVNAIAHKNWCDENPDVIRALDDLDNPDHAEIVEFLHEETPIVESLITTSIAPYMPYVLCGNEEGYWGFWPNMMSIDEDIANGTIVDYAAITSDRTTWPDVGRLAFKRHDGGGEMLRCVGHNYVIPKMKSLWVFP